MARVKGKKGKRIKRWIKQKSKEQGALRRPLSSLKRCLSFLCSLRFRTGQLQGLLGAQPGRPKFDVLPVPGTGISVGAGSHVLCSPPGCSPALRRELLAGINWGHTSDPLNMPQREVCPLTSIVVSPRKLKHRCWFCQQYQGALRRPLIFVVLCNIII